MADRFFAFWTTRKPQTNNNTTYSQDGHRGCFWFICTLTQDKGHPLVGLTRISISILILEEVSLTMHLSCKLIQFENQGQAKIRDFYLCVRDEEVKIIVLCPKKLASIRD